MNLDDVLGLTCPSCAWRAKDPTFFRFVKTPLCPSCGGHLRSAELLEPEKPRPTGWTRLLGEVIDD